MGLEMKRIIVIVTVLLLVLCGISIGLGIKKSPPTLELEVWPREEGRKEPLIQYRATDRDSWSAWVNRTEDFLKEYHVAGNSSRCPSEGVCQVEVANFQPCTADNYYGYYKSSPCVFLRLAKIPGWSPVPYNTTEDLHEDMPEDLKTRISAVAGRPEAATAWLSCKGVAPADKEYMGPVRYIPAQGFAPTYFPLNDQPSPLVAVHFERPKIGVLVNIECRVWAKNIPDHHDIVSFWFLID